jgi:adenine-specific DNA-methyltransferase
MSSAPIVRIESSGPAKRELRKNLGAFYSPETLVLPMVTWAIRSPSESVLDPSCGDGVFLAAAARRLLSLGVLPRAAATQICGIDVNPAAALATGQALEEILGLARARLQTTDFFSTDSSKPGLEGIERVDAVVGNPPYIRYQKFNGATRLQALRKAEAAGVKLPQLTSSWAPFVAHAVTFIRQDGRLAMILPAEIIHAAYARPVRDLLRNRFDEVAIASFRKAVFPGVQEEVVVLLASGRRDAAAGRLKLVHGAAARDLLDLEELLEKAEVFGPDEEPRKWVAGHARSAVIRQLDRLQQEGQLAPLCSLGKANIGFVSGANSFFVLTPREATERGLPDRSLRPCLIKARQSPGIFLRSIHARALQAADERCLLWSPALPLTSRDLAYVKHGEDLGIPDRYKCRVRTPWYSVPGVIVPEAFFTYMSDLIPRICLNQAQLVASNTLLTVRLPGVPRRLLRSFVVAFYNSATLLSCELIGRNYGGGVLKLEPREADRILVPAVTVLEKHRGALSRLGFLVDREIRAGRSGIDDAVRAVDQIVLRAGLGLAASEVKELADARADLLERRRRRNRSSLEDEEERGG